MKRSTKLLVLFAVFAMIVAACSSSDSGDTTTTAGGDAGGDGPVIGVSWNNYNEERWALWDEPAIKAAIEAITHRANRLNGPEFSCANKKISRSHVKTVKE